MGANPAKGYLCVMAAAIMWASSGTAGKALFQTGITPIELVQIRVTLSSVFLLICFGIFSRHLLRIRLRDILYFLLLGGAAMAMVQLSYFYAISKIQVSAAILLEYLAPILVAAYSILFWNERLTAVKITALLLAMAGCFLVVGGYDLQLLNMNRAGILWGLTSAVSFASYTLLGERGLHRYPPWTVIFYAFVFATLTLNIAYKPANYLLADYYSPTQLGCLLYIVIIGTIIPFGLYFVGVNHIRSTRTTITATLEPISAAFMAFYVLGEVLQPFQIVGGMSVISAIVLLQLQREKDKLAPEIIRMQNQNNGNSIENM
jgi:drug/metabolite transporter (DMT)-like permease